jgi:NTE family protein
VAVGFVLGGGGVLGAVEVGMLRALFRAHIKPDLVLGTSIGAINAAMVAVDPSASVIDDLVRLWTTPEMSEVYGDSVPRQMRRFATRHHCTIRTRSGACWSVISAAASRSTRSGCPCT